MNKRVAKKKYGEKNAVITFPKQIIVNNKVNQISNTTITVYQGKPYRTKKFVIESLKEIFFLQGLKERK